MKRILTVVMLAGLVAYGCGSSSKSEVDVPSESGSDDFDVTPPPEDEELPLPDVDAVTPPDEETVTPPDGETVTPPDGETVTPPDVETVTPPDVETVTPPDVETVTPPDVEPDEETVTPPPETYFKSAELGIRILGPSPTGKAQALGAQIQIAGLVMGKPDVMTWETQTGQTGYAEGTPFFLSSQIDLEQGDNFVVVTAVQGDQVASDAIMITYNPAFMFGEDLRVVPNAVFTNSSMDVCFSLDMGLYANFEASSLKLCECTEEGECVSDVSLLYDDGQMVHCDEYGGDGVYSFKKTGFKPTQSGKVCYRTHVAVKAGYQQYTAYSPVSCVEVVDHVTQETCGTVKQIMTEGKDLYNQTIATQDPGAARQAVMALLETKPEVAEVGASYQGYGVWVRFQDGLLGAFNFNQPGMRGGGDPVAEQDLGQIEAALPVPEILVESKKSAVFSPGHTEFGGADEAAYMNDLMEKSECPAYALDGPYYDGKATLQRFRNMSLYGMTAVAAHGDSYFKQMTEEAKKGYEWHHKGSQELIWTGDAVDCTKLVQSTPSCSGPGTCPEGSECIIQTASQTSVSGLCVDMKQVDLRRGRAVFGPDTYGIVPSFVSHYRGRGMPNSMVYLGSCRSMWNGTFGMEFFAAGAKAVLGYSGYVSSAFAYEQATKFLSGLVEEFKLTGDAFPQPAPEDPSNPGTTLRLLGATNLNVTNSDLINPSWEKGDLTGWEKAGDGRVIARLGITVPVEGKFMGVISTGMGYTPQTGEISQMFCIPSDKVEMCFFWKFYSEEFVEWCGSIFQDTFEATLEGEEGTITSVSASVDDLCPPEQCMGCGGQYDGLIQSDVVFDVGDVWNTHWRKACTNIMALAGQGAVTLRFFCTDKGDSIYDTVVLIDAVKFK